MAAVAASDYTTIYTDKDGDWLGLQEDGSMVVFRTVDIDDEDEYGVVSIEKKDIPEVLRKIAELAGVDVLILKKPAVTPARQPLNVGTNLSTSNMIMLDAGFDFAHRYSIEATLELIWKLAEAVAKVGTAPDEVSVRTLKADMHVAGIITPTPTADATKLIALGYRKDPDAATVVRPGIHAFNHLPQVTG
ncbi:hypothetical protein AB0G15_05960 [Streptosporangium sp. NPDC023825]|uniref:hypothetical protein n=1 Tax=Streptosporangium sp. NPDC023825 TaxID=3154909 RepID=UPI00342C8EA5